MQDHQNFLDNEFVGEITESQTALRSYIWKMVGDYHCTEDVLQKTNVVLWNKRMEWDPTTVFLKWAYRIAYFQVKAYCRDRRREQGRMFFDHDVLDVLAHDTPRFESMGDLQQALADCLQKMDKKKRDLLLKRYQKDCSLEEMARKQNCTPNSLAQHLRRLRIKLSHCIQKRLSETSVIPEG